MTTFDSHDHAGMEPPRKRPRLSVFEDQPAAEDLDGARHQNDLLLKSRFEAIFEKYSKDFTTVGDEIDVNTGEIVVDNGHLSGMLAETDTGTGDGPFAISGRSILRAMTDTADMEGSDFENAGADEIMASIETIAENAKIVIDLCSDDSDEELFDQPEITSPEETASPMPDQAEYSQQQTNLNEISDSDDNSLFEAKQPSRQSSPDSLFEVATTQANSAHQPQPIILNDDADEQAIIAKFGENVGQEVLTLMEKRANHAVQALVEPAWRIPVNIRPPARSSSHTHSTTPVLPPEPIHETAKRKGASLWKAPNPVSRGRKSQNPSRRKRHESEDPLQEGFVSDKDEEWSTEDNLDSDDPDAEYRDEAGEADDENEPEEESGAENEDTPEETPAPKVLGPREIDMENAICPFCKKKFKNKAGVIVHFTKLITKSTDTGQEDEVHDMIYIRARKGDRIKPNRGARLLVCDFRTMVELHEGAGMSFNNIAESCALKTKKAGHRLQDVYSKHRDPEAKGGKEWNSDDDELLKEIAQNEGTTMANLNRNFRGRKDFDVGNRLAELWLAELDLSARVKAEKQLASATASQLPNGNTLDDVQVRYTIERPGPEVAQRLQPRQDNAKSSPNKPTIKAEDSEDDLFG